LENVYERHQHGVIDPVLYECDSLVQLLSFLTDYVKVCIQKVIIFKMIARKRSIILHLKRFLFCFSWLHQHMNT